MVAFLGTTSEVILGNEGALVRVLEAAPAEPSLQGLWKVRGASGSFSENRRLVSVGIREVNSRETAHYWRRRSILQGESRSTRPKRVVRGQTRGQ